MESAKDFYVFEKWLSAPPYAFGGRDQPSPMPSEDKEAYWRIYEELVASVAQAVDGLPSKDALVVRPKQFSRTRGSRGHRPVDLYVSVCGSDASGFGYMPQIYVIASNRGLEIGFAASIPEEDYFDAASKARNRAIVPFINAKLPSPESAVVSEIDQALTATGGWAGNEKTRLTAGDPGFARFASLREMIAFLKSEGDVSGGGSYCRVIPTPLLSEVGLRAEMAKALRLFSPLIEAGEPTDWDINILSGQFTADAMEIDLGFDPAGISDGRTKVLQEVARRQGQSKFRSNLLEAYGGKCAVTGCDVPAVLQAAHITPHLGPKTNHISNGLLLRADIHTLFDLFHLTIDPDTSRVVLSASLSATPYWELNGVPLRVPAKMGHRPSPLALQQHYSAAVGSSPD